MNRAGRAWDFLKTSVLGFGRDHLTMLAAATLFSLLLSLFPRQHY
jgi:uncharacterized BrkB/YihY/UPF0761 family membrane protein